MDTSKSQSISVLIAEDDEHIGLAIQTVVERAFDCEKIMLASDGDEAWNILKSHSFDLIISDWNMPGMTGQDLLTKIRQNEKHMTMPFLMLTARADKASVLTAIQAGANDYISKPYQKDQLIEKVNKLVALSKLKVDDIDDLENSIGENANVSQDIIKYILDRFKNENVELPVLPHVYSAVSEAMNDDDVSVNDIIAIIKSEPAISAALITISNSSFYRGVSNNKTLEQAIMRIGLEATKYYIFMIEGRSLFKSDNQSFAAIMTKLWEHSLATATCARVIGQQLNLKNIDTLFSMGLLHDVGKLALIKILAELSEERNDIDENTIGQVFGALHTDIGAIILTQWNFPREIINTTKNHHNLSNQSQRTTELLIVHLANILVRTLGFSLKRDTGIVLDEIESAKFLNINGTVLEQVKEMVKHDVENIKGSF